MLRASRLASGRDVELRVVPLPEGTDPADLIERDGAEALRSLVASSTPFVVFNVTRILERADTRSAEGRDRALSELRPVLNELGASVLRDELVRRVAGRLELTEGRLATLLTSGGSAGGTVRGGPSGQRLGTRRPGGGRHGRRTGAGDTRRAPLPRAVPGRARRRRHGPGRPRRRRDPHQHGAAPRRPPPERAPARPPGRPARRRRGVRPDDQRPRRARGPRAGPQRRPPGARPARSSISTAWTAPSSAPGPRARGRAISPTSARWSATRSATRWPGSSRPSEVAAASARGEASKCVLLCSLPRRGRERAAGLPDGGPGKVSAESSDNTDTQ